jgi:hypothetical protein
VSLYTSRFYTLCVDTIDIDLLMNGHRFA